MTFFKPNFNLKTLRRNENTFFHKTNLLNRLLPFDIFVSYSDYMVNKNINENDKEDVSQFVYFDVLTEEHVVAESNKVGQPFHIVNPSPYPFLLSIFFLFLFAFTICSLRSELGTLGFHWFWIVGLASVLFGWFSEIGYEEFLGNHTLEVQQGFRYGIILFILSEFMLFVSFFWAYFHISLTHNLFTGSAFPPVGVVLMPWDGIPWVNTLVLLTSGITLTLAHAILITNDRRLKSYYWSQYFFAFLKNSPSVFGVYSDKVSNTTAVDFFSNKLNLSYSNLIFSRVGITYPAKMILNLQPYYFTFVDSIPVTEEFYDNFNLENISFTGKFVGETLVTIAINEFVFIKHFFFNNQESGGFKSAKYRYNFFKEIGFYSTFVWLSDVVIRGVVFLGLQAIEYVKSLFTIKTSAFGGCFFSLTGLHCTHVIFGLVMLITCVILSTRSFFVNSQPNSTGRITIGGSFVWGHRVGFDGVAWYWHFVDVVWFVLFTVVYWWPLQKPAVDYTLIAFPIA